MCKAQDAPRAVIPALGGGGRAEAAAPVLQYSARADRRRPRRMRPERRLARAYGADPPGKARGHKRPRRSPMSEFSRVNRRSRPKKRRVPGLQAGGGSARRGLTGQQMIGTGCGALTPTPPRSSPMLASQAASSNSSWRTTVIEECERHKDPALNTLTPLFALRTRLAAWEFSRPRPSCPARRYGGHRRAAC